MKRYAPISMAKLPREILIKRLRTEFASCKRSLEHKITLSRGKFDTFPIKMKVNLSNAPGPIGLKNPRELEYRDNHVFIVEITENYPYQRPLVHWKTPIFHPNIQMPQDGGDVCTKLLDDWGFDSSLVSFVKGIETLLLQPNPKDPWGTDSCTRAAEYFNKYQPRKIKRSKKPPRIIIPGHEPKKPKKPATMAKTRSTLELPPPLYFRLHKWNVSTPNFQLFMSESGLQKIFKHALARAQAEREAVGFLVGTVNRWDQVLYPLVRDAISSRSETKGDARFSRASFGNLLEDLEALDYQYMIVGWYHSAAGGHAELVKKDIETHARMFNKPFHRILKIDPQHQEMKVYRTDGDAFIEVPMAIYSEHLFGKIETEKYTMHKRTPAEIEAARKAAQARAADEAVVTTVPVDAGTPTVKAQHTDHQLGAEPTEGIPLVGSESPYSNAAAAVGAEAALFDTSIEPPPPGDEEPLPPPPGDYDQLPEPEPPEDYEPEQPAPASRPAWEPVQSEYEPEPPAPEPEPEPEPEYEEYEPPPPAEVASEAETAADANTAAEAATMVETAKAAETAEEEEEEPLPPPPEPEPEPVAEPAPTRPSAAMTRKRADAARVQGWQPLTRPSRAKTKASSAKADREPRYRRFPTLQPIVGKKCPKCGFPVEEGWVLCPKCKGSLLV